MSLQGETACVIATGHGLGRDTELTLAERSADVLTTDIGGLTVEILATDTCDMTGKPLDVTNASAKLGSKANAIDVLANRAGLKRDGTTLDCDPGHGAFAARQPMRRFGMSEEMVCYQASDLSAITTGHAVDGGWST